MKGELVILILDSKDVFDLMKPTLAKALKTSQFVHCSTHQEAMKFVYSDQRADIIFADWVLSGFTFIDEVRRDLENHNTPIIIMSEDVTNKKIILNEVENRSTYFLSKPFLDKGLIKKITKVLKKQERRRTTRIQPQQNYFISVDCKQKGLFSWQLIDISISACLLRVPIEITRQISIYDKCLLGIGIDEFKIEVLAELVRIGHDGLSPEQQSTVLIMMKFIDTQSDHIEQLQNMLDELYHRW